MVREALESIDTELQKENGRLTVYQGNPEEIIKKLLETYPITGVFINTSYSPRGKKRDATIRALCEAKSIHFESVKDFLLVEPEEVPVRKVFTPFSKLWNKELHDVSVLPHIYNFSGANTHHLTRWFTPNDRIKISDIISVPHHPFWTV